MNIFRFPEKIPIFFYLIFFFFLLGILSAVSPFLSNQDIDTIISLKNKTSWNFIQITDVHFLILKGFYYLTLPLISDNYQLLRSLNFIYLLIIILVSYKIIKLKFYDLNIWNPIAAFVISGGIIFSVITIQDYLLVGLINLLIFYFFLKTFEDSETNNIIFFNIFSLIALLMGNYYCLVIITILSLIKITNLKLEKEKRLGIISNISFLYIVAIILLIINQLIQEQFILNTIFLPSHVVERLIFIILTLLPLTGILSISLFFNLFKKLNWNKELILFLSIIVISIVVSIFSYQLNLALIAFILPLISIYIFRTLEFVQMKWAKIIYISLFIIPFLIIYSDTYIYQSIEDIPLINYFFYGLIILLSFINPVLSFRPQSIVEAHKIALFSFIFIFSVTVCFFYYQYNDQLTHNVIAKTLEKDLQCKLVESKLKIDENNTALLRLYFNDNINPNFEPSCNIELTLTSLEDLPINDINSVNKTILDLNQKSFMNINFRKL